MDNEYILSGSEDMNLRIWKSISYKPLGNVIFINPPYSISKEELAKVYLEITNFLSII